MAGYAPICALLRKEIELRIAEGCAIDRDDWMARVEALPPGRVDAAEELYGELQRVEPAPNVPFEEPASLKAIHETRPNGVREMPLQEDQRRIFERMHGGWIGLFCGNTLGCPFQMPPYTTHPKNRQRHAVVRWLKGAEAWPLDGYVPGESRAQVEGLDLTAKECTREEVNGAQADPATQGALMALSVLAASGSIDFSTADVAERWLAAVPFACLRGAVCQACLSAMRLEAFARTDAPLQERETTDWERVAMRFNPWRESAEAMPRGLVYGLAAPGAPEKAAEMAWRDARWTHTGPGLQAAMATAAMAAAAYCESDARNLVEIGLSEIPSTGRLAAALRQALRNIGEAPSWEVCWDLVMTRFAHFGPDHAIPNMLILAVGLALGEGDFERTMNLALAMGLNPACNAALTGAIAGIQATSRGLPHHWVAPLSNTWRAQILGMARGTVSDAAGRCFKAAYRTEGAATP